MTDEEKRAANIIWNGAERYDFEPDFFSYDKEGNAQLYLNTIIGLAYKYYDFEKILDLFDSFRFRREEVSYSDVLWIFIECCVYNNEISKRPVLEDLRQEYAQTFDLEKNSFKDMYIGELVKTAHFREALGMANVDLSQKQIEFVDVLTHSHANNTDELIDQVKKIFKEYLSYGAFENLKSLKSKKREKVIPIYMGKKHALTTGLGKMDYDLAKATEIKAKDNGPIKKLIGFIKDDENPEKQKRMISKCFGVSTLDEITLGEYETRICKGKHSGCHLYFTDGYFEETTLKNKEKITEAEVRHRNRATEQRKSNLKYYNDHINETRWAISKLSNKIRNTILLNEEATAVNSIYGSINNKTVWKNLALNEEKVFTRNIDKDKFDMSVDILLDASSSQLKRQEEVALQGYIIAQSLSNCDVPCRIMSYCNSGSFTIFRRYRDYEDKTNEKIFEFYGTGWNRDGLALRTMSTLLSESNYKNKILIVLSDANPNDNYRFYPSGNDLGTKKEYKGAYAVYDAAEEAMCIRRKGIPLVCIFMGLDHDLANGRKIYGSSVAPIKDINNFADMAGMVLQREMSSIQSV